MKQPTKEDIVFNLYYEIPGAGGGNERYANRASALHAAQDIATSYPDAYVEVFATDQPERKLFRHDGQHVAA